MGYSRSLDVRRRIGGSAVPTARKAARAGAGYCDQTCAAEAEKQNKTAANHLFCSIEITIMNNIVRGVIFGNYAILAALGSFCLLLRRRVGLAISYPERVLAFEQVSFLFDGRVFPCRLNPPKPGLPWIARSDISVAYFGRGSGPGVAVSPQRRLL